MAAGEKAIRWEHKQKYREYLEKPERHPLYSQYLKTFMKNPMTRKQLKEKVDAATIQIIWRGVWKKHMKLIEDDELASKLKKYRKMCDGGSYHGSGTAKVREKSSSSPCEVISESASPAYAAPVESPEVQIVDEVEEVGEPVDIVGKHAVSERKNFPYVREEGSEELSVRSVLEMALSLKDKLGGLADALPLFSLKTREAELAGINELSMFGPEELAIFQMMVDKLDLLAQSGSSSQDAHAMNACGNELRHLMYKINRHRSLDITKIAISQMGNGKPEILLAVGKKQLSVKNHEPVLRVYESVRQDQTAMKNFIRKNSLAILGLF